MRYLSLQVGGERTEIAASSLLPDARPSRHPRLAAAAAGDGAARAVHPLAGARDLHRQLLVDARGRAGRRASSASTTTATMVGRPGVLAGARRTICWFALGTIPVSIALALLMALWVNDRIAGPRAPAHGLFHADRAADDRGRQHLAVLLHAAIRPARADRWRCSASPRTTGSARRTPRSPAVIVVAIWKEAGFFMIFYLAALQRSRPRLARGRGARRRVALVLLPPRAVPAADADHAVRAGQRGDQRVPHRRPHRRDDARRTGQRDRAAARIYIYEVGFNFWDTTYAAALTMVLLALLALVALGAVSCFLERRMHYR